MKRGAPLKRVPFKPREGPSSAPRETKPRAEQAVKPRTCTQCPRVFVPARPLQRVCSQRCAMKPVKAAAVAKKAAERADTKARKEALKTIADRIAAAQKEFNTYIRLRDAGKGCIDCGKPFEPQKPGGSMDAGHYLSRGASTHLRFNEDNVFGQRKNCNRPGGASRADFRNGVLTRIGQARLDAIEADYTVHKWTHGELIAITATYRQKARELKKAREAA